MNKQQYLKNKILFVTNDLAGYGASLSLINLYNSIKNNYECYFAICGSSVKKELAKNISIVMKGIDGSITIPCYHWRHIFTNLWWLLVKPISILLCIIKLCKIIKQYNIDIVHTNVSVIPCGLIAAKICNVKHVWHLREYIYKDQGHYPIIGFGLLRWLIRKSDYVIPISKEIKDFYKTKFESIYDAVFATNSVLPCNNKKEDYILFLGSLTVAKQPEQAIEIFAQVSSIYPKLRLKICGTGDLEIELKERAKKLGIDSRVDFLGYVKEPYQLFNSAKAFLMTSRFEGMGRTTIEAMANDCLVIGYNSGGTANIIQDGITGFLCDNKDIFVLKLKRILNSNDNYQNIRCSARKWAKENCSEEMYKEKIANIYQGLLKK